MQQVLLLVFEDNQSSLNICRMSLQDELAEIIANHEYELSVVPQTTYLASWTNCFQGGLRSPSSNLRRTLCGIGLQMMQQLTGINFIFYYGVVFFTR